MPDRPYPGDQLSVIDQTQAVIEDHPEGRLYYLAARIEGALSRPTDQLGPALNALYAQALRAVLVDPSLGGLTSDVREGGEAGLLALEVDVSHDAYSGPAGLFGLNLVLPYWQSAGAAPLREPILAALTAALGANTPGPSLCLREQVLAAFHGHLAASIGQPVRRNADRPQDCRPPGPVIVFRDGEQEADHTTIGRVLYAAHAAVEVFVPGKDTVALDAWLQLVLQAIDSAGQLGGLAVDVVEGNTDPEILRQEYTGALLAGRVDVDLYFATRAGDPYTVRA